MTNEGNTHGDIFGENDIGQFERGGGAVGQVHQHHRI
jgi:hypothetical protein